MMSNPIGSKRADARVDPRSALEVRVGKLVVQRGRKARAAGLLRRLPGAARLANGGRGGAMRSEVSRRGESAAHGRHAVCEDARLVRRAQLRGAGGLARAERRDRCARFAEAPMADAALDEGADLHATRLFFSKSRRLDCSQ